MSKSRRALPSESAYEPPEIAPARFFVLRATVWPFEAFLSLGEGLLAPDAIREPKNLPAALAKDRARQRAVVGEWLRRPLVKDALFVASPSLEESLPLWEEEPDSERGQKTERALLRYLQRMCTRPTPFGLFAACSLGKTGEETRLSLGEGLRRYTRLDMHYLCALAEALEGELRPSLRFWPNSSLYPVIGQLRYVEGRVEDIKRGRSYHLVSVTPTDYLLKTLSRAQEGATVSALAEGLVDEEVSLEEAEEYIHTLIENQLLVSELEPLVTGPDPLDDLCEVLSPYTSHPAASLLKEVRGELRQMDREGPGASPARYRAVAERLRALGAPVDISRLFQVDMARPSPALRLGEEVSREIQRGILLLHQLSLPTSGGLLEQLRQRFLSRYEEREIPLAEALDEESGLGFDGADSSSGELSPLLEGLDFPPSRAEQAGSFQRRDALLLRRLEELARMGERELRLDEALVAKLKNPVPPPLPDSFAAMCTVYASSEEHLAKGDFQVYLHGVSGPSGAMLLGRFCHVGPALEEEVKALLREEEALRPGAIFAEIVHLPQGRLGNILYRPRLRPYEIPFLARASAPKEERIPIQDLLLSVRGGRFVLRSKRLGKEIIPRMTNAHNYSGADLGLYRFLCMLQRQGLGYVGWSFGALESLSFLPRVSSGRLLFSLARWSLSQEDFAPLSRASGEALFLAARALRQKLSLPRLVALVDSDNLLPIDFDSILSLESFASLLSRRERIVLRELFPGEPALPVRAKEGSLLHELVLPFSRKRLEAGEKPDPASRDESPDVSPSPAQRRSFPPGSEWLYLKLYTGSATADRVLREGVRPLVDKVLGSGEIKRWFFLRYGDPDWHLRLRFAGAPSSLREVVLRAVEETIHPLWEEGLLWRLQWDTYEREVERYGGAQGILLSEEIFWADSEAVLRLVERLSSEEGADARWRLVLLGMDRLLGDLGFSLLQKRELLGRARAGFTEEFGRSPAFEKQLDARYRALRPALSGLLSPLPEGHPLAEGEAIFGERSLQCAPAIADLREAEARKKLTTPLLGIAGSYLHMHANRLLRSAAREQERVLYDFLHRLYDSELARQKKG